jgi:hypothetical protein
MFSSEKLREGDIYSRRDLGKIFETQDATINTGIFPLPYYHAILLFITEDKAKDKTQYNDILERDLLLWDGQTKGLKDKLIIDHEKNGMEILVFYRKSKNEYEQYGFKYEGRFRYVSYTGSQPAHFVLQRVGPIATISQKETKVADKEVSSILNIVNTANNAHQLRETNTPSKSLKIIFCYARKDEKLRKELEKHLSPLKRIYSIDSWFDKQIDPGSDWKNEIALQLNTANIILLLISSDFMASQFCYEIEMQRAIERHERGEACVIPIILRPTYWQDTPLGKIQALPRNGQSVTDRRWGRVDNALHQVVGEIKDLIERQFAALIYAKHD